MCHFLQSIITSFQHGFGGLQAGMNIFVEKPLSVKPVEEVDRLAKELKKVQEQNGVTIAVGYMLRYSPAVEVGPTSAALIPTLGKACQSH